MLPFLAYFLYLKGIVVLNSSKMFSLFNVIILFSLMRRSKYFSVDDPLYKFVLLGGLLGGGLQTPPLLGSAQNRSPLLGTCTLLPLSVLQNYMLIV